MESRSRGTSRTAEGASASGSYCVSPGNSSSGYCREKLTGRTSWPRPARPVTVISVKCAMPPRYGCIGPTTAMRNGDPRPEDVSSSFVTSQK